VTLDKAALWTDGRYFIRAEQELYNTSWILVKSGTFYKTKKTMFYKKRYF
jgi:hypothetical protein